MGITLGALLAGLAGGWLAKALHIRANQVGGQKNADALNSLSEPLVGAGAAALADAVDKKAGSNGSAGK